MKVALESKMNEITEKDFEKTQRTLNQIYFVGYSLGALCREAGMLAIVFDFIDFLLEPSVPPQNAIICFFAALILFILGLLLSFLMSRLTGEKLPYDA